jgi:signal transduction histidine kinase/ActR/RegA family two-component response regulator
MEQSGMQLRFLYLSVFFWLMLLVMVMIGIILSDINSAKLLLINSVNSHYQQVSDRVRTNEAVLEGFAALVSSMQDLDRPHIRNYAKEMLKQYPHIFMFEIVEAVPYEKLDAFIKHYQVTVNPDFKLKRFGYETDRKIKPVKKQDMYLPIVFMEPFPAESQEVLGLDLFSNNFFNRSFSKNLPYNRSVITKPFKLIEGNLAYLIYKPISMNKISNGQGISQRAVMLVIMADTLLDREQDIAAGMTDILHHRDFEVTDEEGFLHLHQGAARSDIEKLIFPGYKSRIILANKSQPFVLINEYQLGWDTLSWPQLIIIFVAGMVSFIVLIFYVRLYGKNEIRRIQISNELEEKVYELDIALEQSQQASKAKSLFLANVSHEIRTPMNGVLGMIQVLRGTTLNDEQRSYLDILHSSSKILLSLIDDLLDLSKIESGKLTLNIEPFETSGWVIDIQNITVPFFENKKTVLFNTEVSDDLPAYLEGDATRLVQIASNLISNAVKCTQAGEIKLTIGGGLIKENQFKLHISVKDTGIGIADDKLKIIFEAFHQLELDRTINKGVGLGLTICKRLTDIMGGSLHVSSRPDKGSCFTFSAILTIPENYSSSKDTEEEIKTNHALSILLVDDDSINRYAARTLLEQAGQKVVEAENGQDAIEKTKSQVFDVILMDVHMPVMDGVEATRRIRDGNREGNQVPIIGITASVMSNEKDVYLKAGMNAVVEKPILINKLMATIQQLNKTIICRH